MNIRTKIIFTSVVIGIIASLILALLFGIPTALIPTKYYKRMIAATFFDYFFLAIIPVLSGIYVAVSYYKKQMHKQYTTAKSDYLAAGGIFPAIFAISCPICSMLLVSAFGTAALMTYFDPYRPLLGMLAVLLLGAAIYIKARSIRICKKCAIRKKRKIRKR